MNDKIYSKDSDVYPAKDTGPEAADGVDLDVKELKFDSYTKIFSQKDENLAKESLNNSKMPTMNTTENDNVFDKLYKTIMESDDFPPMEDELPFEGGDELEDAGDDELGGEQVTLTLDKDVAQKLFDMLSAELDAGDDAELEDLDDGEDDESDPFSSGDPFEDSVQVQAEPRALPDSNLKSGNNSNKDNKVKASGYHGGGGKASSGNIPEQQADPKELPDSNLKSGNNSSKNNHVKAGGYSAGEFVK